MEMSISKDISSVGFLWKCREKNQSNQNQENTFTRCLGVELVIIVCGYYN